VYDPKSEGREFVGESRSEAVAKATSFFGLDESALSIVELDPKDVSGLAARTMIVAAPREARGRAPAPAERERERERGGRPEGGFREGRGGRDRGGRERGRERERGGRAERVERGERVERVERGPAEERGEAGPSVGAPQGELGAVGAFVRGLVERLEVGSFTIAQSSEGELTVIQLSGPAATRLAAGDGRTVDAVQLLVNQVAVRLEGENAKRVVIDAEGDPEGREAYLSRLAERAAERAGETGRSVALDPMSPKDRRIIHVALREWDGIATMSVGAGRYRQVVVVPEGAPEWEEARRQAAASASRTEG
jgi:spoIIIJ-associated protein